jgi:D-3-phosphoglycerate dehydrogenase / 2-oxoglutarate reductase
VKYKLSVLDVTAEEIKKIIVKELEGLCIIEFASTYDRKEQLDLAARADFLWVGWPPVDAEMIEKSPNLQVIHKCGVGVDEIDLNAAKARNIKVYITEGINAVPVSEMALLLIMAVLRRLVFADTSLRKGKWLKTELRGQAQHLTGKTVGIIGMGNIGRNLAKLLNGFDCKVHYFDIHRNTSEVDRNLGVSYMPFNDLLRSCEVISLHAPLTPHTSNMINANALRVMGRNAILINTARGGLVVEKALIDALRSGTIAGAGLDVFELEPLDPNNPLLAMDNVVLSPHVAGSTLNNISIRAKRIAHNLGLFHNGGNIEKADIILG